MELLHNSPLEVSINMKLRYKQVVDKLEALKKRTPELKVLEVGSGSKGVTRFFKHPVVGIDVEFQKYKNKWLKEIVLSATKKFPFKDQEFDVVISVDTIEHIPKKERVKALKEIKRVSKKYIILEYPTVFTKWDDRVIKKWPKKSEAYLNIKEHLDAGIPDGSEISQVFKGCNVSMQYGTSSGLSYFIRTLEHNVIGKVFSRTILKLLMPLFYSIKGTSKKCYFIIK